MEVKMPSSCCLTNTRQSFTLKQSSEYKNFLCVLWIAYSRTFQNFEWTQNIKFNDFGLSNGHPRCFPMRVIPNAVLSRILSVNLMPILFLCGFPQDHCTSWIPRWFYDWIFQLLKQKTPREICQGFGLFWFTTVSLL